MKCRIRKNHPNDEKIAQLKKLLGIVNELENDCLTVLSNDAFKAIEASNLDYMRALDKSYLKRSLRFLYRQRDSDKLRWTQSKDMKYVHPDTLERHKEYVEQQNSYLASCAIINPQTGLPLVDDKGKIITLPDLVKIAKKRYAEHCARAKAMVEAAKERGYEAMLCTITLPSRFHAMKFDKPKNKSQRKLIPNPAYDFSTVYEGYRYLNDELRTIFRRFNNNFKSRDNEYYYINTVQPTESGTPHFHLILFGKQRTLQRFQDAYRKYCLSISNDVGFQNRKGYVDGISVEWKSIRPKKDSSQSSIEASMNYISRALKYVTRAISEFDNEKDIHEAQCIAAFASNNRLRLVRYSAGSFSAYRAIRKGVSQGVFDGIYLGSKISEVLDTFSKAAPDGRKLGKLNFKKLSELLISSTKSGTPEKHFLPIKEKVMNRYHEEVDRVIGFELFGKAFYFIKYEIIQI